MFRCFRCSIYVAYLPRQFPFETKDGEEQCVFSESQSAINLAGSSLFSTSKVIVTEKGISASGNWIFYSKTGGKFNCSKLGWVVWQLANSHVLAIWGCHFWVWTQVVTFETSEPWDIWSEWCWAKNTRREFHILQCSFTFLWCFSEGEEKHAFWHFLFLLAKSDKTLARPSLTLLVMQIEDRLKNVVENIKPSLFTDNKQIYTDKHRYT